MTAFEPLDRVGAYAKQVRDALDTSNGRTVAEICASTKLSDGLVRQALERLVFQKALTVTLRHTPHRRGAMPFEYRLAKAEA